MKPREWWIIDADSWEDDCGRSIFARRKEDLKDSEGEAFNHVIEHAAYVRAVAALKWYDGVHRQHWAIDLNDLPKIAQDTLKELGELPK